MKQFHTQKKYGFTLVELLVTISIIAILSTIVIANLSDSRAKARDTQRQTDLEKVAVALEIYRELNGVYPLSPPSCSGGTHEPTEWYSPGPGINSGYHECENYIEGLVPNALSKLPIDPASEYVSDSGYLYRSNGSDYKLMSYKSVESEDVYNDHDYFRCSPQEPVCPGEPCDVNHPETIDTYAIYTKGAECW